MSDEPRPSATVAVIRDAGRLEVLLLERTRARGTWVFPGGKIDAADRPPGGTGSGEGWEETARRAAVREAREEAALALDAEALVPISRWITPELSPRRFDTLFFLTRVARDVEVRPDGGEMHSHRWWTPCDALEAHHRAEIVLAPPTFVTISWLSGHPHSDDALAALSAGEIVTFRPRICKTAAGQTCILYPGDAGYESSEPEREGARHRLWVQRDGWRYERSRGYAAARRSGV
jgi:8-oxo-dGTP pyrophosphatase MutT (NUDIX family)